VRMISCKKRASLSFFLWGKTLLMRKQKFVKTYESKSTRGGVSFFG
jgi:hypothetical protein